MPKTINAKRPTPVGVQRVVGAFPSVMAHAVWLAAEAIEREARGRCSPCREDMEQVAKWLCRRA